MATEDDLKESINKHIKLIKNLSSLSNIQAIVFVNILSINNPEMFNKLREITKWESKVLSEFMQESDRAKEKKKQQSKKEVQ
jgi:hypothetical protein